MPGLEMDWKITPQAFISALNLVSIMFIGGMIYANMTGDIASNKKAIVEIRNELQQLREQNTSIAVIKNDISNVKDSVSDLKSSVQRIEDQVIKGSKR